MKGNYKRVPFETACAKRIENGEIDGRLLASIDGYIYPVRVLEYNAVKNKEKIVNDEDKNKWKFIVTLIDTDYQQVVQCFDKNGYGLTSDGKTIELVTEVFKEEKYEFNSFDKVLVRNNDNGIWLGRFFEKYTNEYYWCTDGGFYSYCIPYEGNESLLGTTNNIDN